MGTERIMTGCERKFVDVALRAVERDGTFSGYASLFGRVDLGKDMVERGAFARSLRERGTKNIRMLYQHDPAEPIGTWTEIREDSRGLFVRGKIASDVARGREVLALMRQGALDGLSIGFRTRKARHDTPTGVRHILEADLWEISVVTFPMLPGARVETVKGRAALHRAPTAPQRRAAMAALARAARRRMDPAGSLHHPDATKHLTETIRRAIHIINRKRTNDHDSTGQSTARADRT